MQDMARECYGCGQKNDAAHLYCSACGSPLNLASYIAREVDSRLLLATKEQTLVEKESAIRIFERSWSWAKIVLGIGSGIVTLLVASLAYFSVDFHTAARDATKKVSEASSAAEGSISATAQQTKTDIATASSQSAAIIQQAANQARESGRHTQKEAATQEASIRRQVGDLKGQLQAQALRVTKEVDSARQQIKSASELQPALASMRTELQSAQNQIKEQQQVLTSSEDFAKKLFSSQQFFTIDLRKSSKLNHAIINTTLDGVEAKAVYVLLPDAPVISAVRIQYAGGFSAAANSYVCFHNLLVFFLTENSMGPVLQAPISLQYFADTADKIHITSLEVKGGRVYADGEALPKLGQLSDPDFTGSKWFPSNTVPLPENWILKRK